MADYKLTENGNIVAKDGKPVAIGDDEKEYTVDALGSNEKFTELSRESAKHRKKASTYKKDLDAVILERDELKIAVSSFDDKTKDQLEEFKKNTNKIWEEKQQAWEAERGKLSGDLFNATVLSKFATSPVAQTTIFPPNKLAQIYKSSFNPDGTAELDGSTILSREKPGEPAEFDEALKILIDADPDRDSILKSKVHGGGGSRATLAGGEQPAKMSATDKIKAGLAARQK